MAACYPQNATLLLDRGRRNVRQIVIEEPTRTTALYSFPFHQMKEEARGHYAERLMEIKGTHIWMRGRNNYQERSNLLSRG